jgi:hypothetical protein
MKLASVLAGATAVALALTATAASAQGPVYRGAATGTINNIPLIGSFSGHVNTGDTWLGFDYGTPAVKIADALNPGINSDVALFTMASDGFSGNTAALTTNVGATFSLTGQVSADCAYYTGGTNTDVNFGTIGINTSDNNPNGAFEMVGGDRTLEISSNLAGCNTKNTVKFTKTDLQNASQLSASYTAGVVGATSNADLQTVNLTQGGNVAVENTYGAWKSPLNMTVKMKNPGKGLLAGTYNGSVSVTIAVAA